MLGKKKNDIGIVLLMQEGTTLPQIMFNKILLTCITFELIHRRTLNRPCILLPQMEAASSSEMLEPTTKYANKLPRIQQSS
jgi:hypothetical protein